MSDMPVPPAQPNTPAGRSVLAADLRVTGEITGRGTVEIMGEVEGSVTAQSVLVANDGRVTGNIAAEQVEIRGRMEGTVSCKSIALRSAASARMDVNYEVLVIDSGAQIDGRFIRPRG